MPEGDTILRTARALDAALRGKKLTRVLATVARIVDAGLAGRTVEAVEARGKHLLVHLDGGHSLHTHMRMTGSWHLYRPGERWRAPREHARLVLEVDDAVAVCFAAPVVELIRSNATGDGRLVAEGRDNLRRLGLDILAPRFDVAEAVARLKTRPELAIADALLAQSLVAGIGNIWKTESLFAAKVHPFTPVAALSDASLAAVLSAARRLMQASVGAAGRHPMAAYRRGAEPCRACGTPIVSERPRHGDRTTWWCPTCQPA